MIVTVHLLGFGEDVIFEKVILKRSGCSRKEFPLVVVEVQFFVGLHVSPSQ